MMKQRRGVTMLFNLHYLFRNNRGKFAPCQVGLDAENGRLAGNSWHPGNVQTMTGTNGRTCVGMVKREHDGGGGAIGHARKRWPAMRRQLLRCLSSGVAYMGLLGADILRLTHRVSETLRHCSAPSRRCSADAYGASWYARICVQAMACTTVWGITRQIQGAWNH
jgi:hypothetical protein